MVKKIISLFLLGLCIFCLQPVWAQTSNEQDFSKIQVDELSDAQIRQLMQQVEASGLGEDQLEQIAAARGMNATEITKLRQRVELIKKQGAYSKPPTSKSNQEKKEKDNEETSFPADQPQKELTGIKTKIFGARLFSNANRTFEPSLRIATPVDYIIGPDDEILIDIYGHSEASYQLKVSPDGTINVPSVGVIPLSGASMEQATSRIRAKLSTIYSGIKNGSTSVSVSLGKIRSLKVILTGEIERPGTYTLPSLATVFNALYASGGPNENGSFRQVEIVRGGEIIKVLDVYDFLLYGSLKDNIRLRDQDVIRVPPYQNRVEISGQMKRQGIYEMKYGESLSDLLHFAGNFNEKAYRARIKVVRNTATDHTIEDVTSEEFKNFVPASGDQYFVQEILDRYQNRVTLSGAVFRPGEYQLTQGLTLTQLVQKADGLKEDAFVNRGFIIRVKEDLSKEMIAFNIQDILSNKAPDIALQREDEINIPSVFDLKEAYKLTINGEVRNPGIFQYAAHTTLEGLIIQAGGFRESATAKRIEISRRLRNQGPITENSKSAQVFQVDINKDMAVAQGFELMPYDIVTVRTAPGYTVQKEVRIEGEVLFPGKYTIENKNERISDLIKRAGGLTNFAYDQGASLKRTGSKETETEREQESLKLKQFEKLQKKSTDSAKVEPLEEESVRNVFVGINLPRIMDHPGRRYDLLLEDGDIITIPKQLQTVKVSGEVLSPVSVIYVPGLRFKKYVSQSGGFSPKALKKRSYIIYANGNIASNKRFLFFNNFPKVKPGAEIFIPTKEDRQGLTTSEIIAISTGLVTVATLIFAVFR